MFARGRNALRSFLRDPQLAGMVQLVVMSPPMWDSAAVTLKEAMVLTAVVRKEGCRENLVCYFVISLRSFVNCLLIYGWETEQGGHGIMAH